MLTIIRHIEFLLRSNDCVTIPGFGAFVVMRCESTFDETEMLSPSCRRVGFNALLNHNDGMLAGSIMRHGKMSYAAAVEIIDNEVAVLRAQLQELQEFRFGDLGEFRLSETGAVEFTPSDDISLVNLDTYGLPVFRFGRLSDGSEHEEEVEAAPVGRSMTAILVRRALKTAAVVAVLVLCLFTLTTPIAIDQSVDMANVAAIVPKRHNAAKPRKAASSQMAVPVKQKKAEQPVAEEKSADYAIIVASFTSARQAEKYVTESGDTTLTIIDAPKGSRIYKVALCEGTSREALEKIIAERRLADTYPGVWVSHK